MTPEAALVERLTTHGAVAALVEDRVYAKRFPQGGTLPAIVYRREPGQDGLTNDGATGPEEPRFQVDAMAATYPQAVELSEAIRDVLHGKAWLTSEGDQVVGRVALAPMDQDNEGAEISPGVPLHERIADYFLFFGKVA